MVTEYQLPFPLRPSVITQMITDLLPEASKDVNVCHEIFYLKESPKVYKWSLMQNTVQLQSTTVQGVRQYICGWEKV